MPDGIYLLYVVVLAAIAYLSYRAGKFMKYGGKMLVICPETGRPAAVKVSVWRAIGATLTGRRNVELSDCSRWPEKEDCAQECLCQIEADPRAHRVWVIASKWYEGKTCAFCKKPIEQFDHLDRKPALLSPDGTTFEWNAIPPEALPEAMWGCLPVCWNCHIAETFIREHPDRVTMRPWERSGPLGEYVPKKHEEHTTTPK